ncbi:MAG: succinate dehydrogenase assembly factor 2 [Rhizobiales bacterium]|nr:succinate dehydrogenase assembly factor 2 [Hyphomicrobiales bacterium]
MTSSQANLETARKRLTWRASHRGTRELDLVVGGFVRARATAMTVGEIAELEELLELPDDLLQAWLTKSAAVPPEQDSALLQDLLSYRP